MANKISADLSGLVNSLSGTKKELQDILNIFGALSASAANLSNTLGQSFGVGGGQIVGPTGAKVISISPQAPADFAQAISGQQSSVGAAVSNIFNPAPLFSTSNYGLKDLPRVLGGVGTSIDVSKSLENQIARMSKGSESDRAVAKIAEDIKKNMMEQKDSFQRVLREFTAAQASGDSQAEKIAQDKLIKAMASLEQSIEEASDINKDIARMGGGGVGGGGATGGSGFFSGKNAISMAKAAGVAIAAAGAGATIYNSTAAAFNRQMMGAQSGYFGASFGMQGMAQDQLIQSRMMATPEQMLLQHGDFLFRDTKFLGRRGFDEASKIALQESNMETEIKRRERNAAMIGSITSGVSGGILASAAALGLGLAPATGGLSVLGSLAIGAVTGAGAGGIAAYNRYYSDEYTALTGGQKNKFSSFLGNLFMGDDYDRLADFRQRQAQEAKRLESMQRTEALRQSELSSRRVDLLGLSENMKLFDLQQSGIREVGPYAMTRRMALGMIPGISGVGSFDEAAADAAVETKRNNLKRFRDSMARYPEVMMNSENAALVERITREKQAAIDSHKEDLKAAHYRSRMAAIASDSKRPLTSFEAYGMTVSDFGKVYNASLLQYGPGERVTSGMREDAMSLFEASLGGLGSIQQLASNRYELSRITGNVRNDDLQMNLFGYGAAMGFKTTPQAAQDFLAATTGAVSQVGSRNIDFLTGRLMAGASNYGPGFVGLNSAISGFQGYDAATRGAGGISGALKMFGMFAGGATLGGTGSVMMGMSAPEMSASIDELSKNRSEWSYNTRVIVDRAGSVEVAKKQLSQTKQGASALITGSAYFADAIVGKGNLSELIQKAKTYTDPRSIPSTLVQQIMDSAYVAGQSTEAGGFATSAAFLDELGISGENKRSIIDQQIDKAKVSYKEVANSSLARFIDNATKSAASATQGLSAQDYVDTARAGASRIKFKNRDDYIDPETLNKIINSKNRTAQDEAYLRDANAALSDINRIERLRQTPTDVTNTQNVVVGNFQDLVNMLVVRPDGSLGVNVPSIQSPSSKKEEQGGQ